MKHKILIVDDDDIALFLHSTLLIDCGAVCEPQTFNSASAAISYLENPVSADNHYLIFLDINMPIMNGWGFLEKLNGHPLQNNIQVVMVTSSTENSEKKKALNIQLVKDFLIKPLKEKDLSDLQSIQNFESFFNKSDNAA
ncbi:response regulator [Pedobacter lithocola]|uniref:Response regulator n=1 Tax=Pedobacter lithocola TaxID=1908239 RepID=A0ABV8P6T4_9SPHI